MFDQLNELRYPWLNSYEYFRDGYWHEIASMHLSLGWLFICIFSTLIASRNKLNIELKFSIIYFSLTAFNNPAYNFLGLNINEAFGILSLFILIFRRWPRSKNLSPAVIGLITFFCIATLHSVLAMLVYPDLTPNASQMFLKLAVNFKVLILAVNLAIIGFHLDRTDVKKGIVDACLATGTFALLMYLLQMVILIRGTTPYGTFIDAGFIGVPSFGSISIERGHFGKFMTAYFPFFLYGLIAYGAKWRFLLFCVISSINFSASSQIFFVFAMTISFILFFKLLSIKSLVLLICSVLLAMIFFMEYIDVFQGIFDKIYSIAILGDESHGGGRSLGVFMEYIKSYPFGMGYSGSSLRIAPGLPDINAAHFAFVSQLSILSLPLLAGFIYILIKTLRRSLKTNLLSRCMSVGVLMVPIVFFVDILWFVPLFWLTIEIALRTKKNSIPKFNAELGRKFETPSPVIGNVTSN